VSPDPPNPIHRRVDAVAAPRSGPLPIDWLLLLAVLGLVACSIVAVGEATANDVDGDPRYYVYRQGAYALIGLVLMALLTRMDYTRLRELKYGFYAGMIGLIVLVIAVGSTTRGSRRAFSFPFFSFQPSELGKLLLILALSAFVVDRVRRLGDRATTVRVMVIALVPALLVMLQPDLGTGLVYVTIGLATLFVVGTGWRHFAVMAAIAAAIAAFALTVAPAAGVQLLQPYQVDRLTAFLNPSGNPAKEGYQQSQSKIAIGAGQKTGRGEGRATQTQLNFLPEHHTDFIFSVVGERYGFMGAALVLSLYALLIWRSLRILTLAKNLYGALLAGGIVAMLMFQIFVNIGMTVGIMPITGVPLPLMSYGGSSTLVTFLALGILQSIYVQARIASASKGRVFSY